MAWERTKKLRKKFNVLGKPQTELDEMMAWRARAHSIGSQALDEGASFIVRSEQKFLRSTVPIHPDSFARTVWDVLLLICVWTTIVTDPVRSVSVCCYPPAVSCSTSRFCVVATEG